MTSNVIAYDEPVTDLIAELDATKHVGFVHNGVVEHQDYKKTMVTLHHNGGGPNFTFADLIRIWTYREASAHFDVDAKGTVGQFAEVHDYAWACANTWGNETSISIEMANSALSPTWAVSETTWKSAARLTGWLFAHVIGTRPTAETLVYHHHWYATDCAGPHMDSIYSQVLAAAQSAYDDFTNHPTPTPTPTPIPQLDVDGLFGEKTIVRWAQAMGTHTGTAALIEAVQEFLNAHGVRDENGNRLVVDGVCDLNNTQHPTVHQHTTAAIERYLGTPIDGFLSCPSTCVRVLQERLNRTPNGSGRF